MHDERTYGNEGNDIDSHDTETVVSGKQFRKSQSTGFEELKTQKRRRRITTNKVRGSSQRGSAKVGHKSENHLYYAEYPALVEAELCYISQPRVGVTAVH